MDDKQLEKIMYYSKENMNVRDFKTLLKKCNNENFCYYYDLLGVAYDFKVNNKSISFVDSVGNRERLTLNSNYTFFVGAIKGVNVNDFEKFKKTVVEKRNKRKTYKRLNKKHVTIYRKGDNYILVNGTIENMKDVLQVIKHRGFKLENIIIKIRII